MTRRHNSAWPVSGWGTGRWRALAALILAAASGGCANGLETSSLATLDVPELPKISAPVGPPPIVGSPTEVYTRIARGALGCWFAANGPLKGTHVFHADAEPAHKGGRAEIVIHERDLTAPSPRGLKAFRIIVEPVGDSGALTIENLKLPKPVGDAMEQDVRRWGSGAIGCGEPALGWNVTSPGEVSSTGRAPSKATEKARSR